MRDLARTLLRSLLPRRSGGGVAAPATTPVPVVRPLLDTRGPAGLAGAVVPGSFALPGADAVRLYLALPSPLDVLADDDAATRALAEVLTAHGLVARPILGGITGCRAVGHVLREPAWKSPLPPGHAVTLTGPEALAGWVQDVSWAGTEFRFDVLAERDGALVRLADLPEEALRSRGARGAAGLGVVS